VTSSLTGRRPAAQPYAGQVQRDPSAPSSFLWSPLALFRWGGIVLVALVVIVSCWYTISGKDNWNDQVASMNLALASLVVAQAAGIGLLLAGRRVIGLRRVALLGEASEDYVPASAAASAAGPVAAASSVVLVGEAGRAHYHRADCPMAAGRNWPEASELELQRAGLTPCGVCRP